MNLKHTVYSNKNYRAESGKRKCRYGTMSLSPSLFPLPHSISLSLLCVLPSPSLVSMTTATKGNLRWVLQTALLLEESNSQHTMHAVRRLQTQRFYMHTNYLSSCIGLCKGRNSVAVGKRAQQQCVTHGLVEKS